MLIIFIILLFAAPFVAWLMGEFLITEQPLERADAIFVFSGSLAYGERTNRAAILFDEKRAAKIVLTNDGEQAGWESAVQRNPFYWEWERWNLLAKNIPADSIELLPEVVRGTNDEAVLLCERAKKENWKSVILVTSPFHTRRAAWAVRRACARANVEIEIGIVPAKSRAEMPRWWTSLKNWRNAASEYLKFAYYWLFY